MKKLIILFILLTGCVVGKNFRSPKVPLPDKYINNNDTTQNCDTLNWWLSFKDPMLDTIMQRAIRGNKNLASAVQNIEIARLTAISSHAGAYPSLFVDGSADVGYDMSSKSSWGYSLKPTISWDIDLWGKVQRQAEAAGASYLATEFEAAAIMQNLEAQVATSYFSALSYKMALEVSRSTYLSRVYTTNLMDSMYSYGAISDVDLQQSRTSTQTAAVAVEQYQRMLKQNLLSLNVLMGENPMPIQIGNLTPISITIPSGLPSSLLENRPDVMQAYYAVQQANAMVGVAIANRLPSVSLTGSGGLATSVVNGLATAKPLSWSASASLLAPILNWGTLKRNEKIAKIKTQQALLAYEDAVLTAINEVEQSLVAVDTYLREVEQSRAMVESSLKARELTLELYKAGNNSYLDLLDADRTLLSAQLQYAQTLMQQIDSYITLYKALGMKVVVPRYVARPKR